MTQPTPLALRRHRRRMLIDPRFQLKYTGLLVGVVVAVMLALGAVIWRTAREAVEQGRRAAEAAEVATRESRTSSRITRMDAMMQAADNPELVRVITREIADADRAAERRLAEARAQRATLERQPSRIFALLVGAGAGLAALLALLGVVITHRIVGPVHKLKRLLRRVGTGRLVVRERLRRGDELEDLFDTFLQMTYSLTALHKGRLATLDATIRKAEATGAAPEVLQGLRALRAQMGLPLGGEAGAEERAAR